MRGRIPIGAIALPVLAVMSLARHGGATEVVDETDLPIGAPAISASDSLPTPPATRGLAPDSARTAEATVEPVARHATRHNRQPGASPVAIQAEFNPMAMGFSVENYVSYNQPELPAFELGLRLYPAKRIGFDVMMGFSVRTDIERQTQSETSQNPGSATLYPELGAIADLIHGRVVSLGVVGRFGMLLQQTAARTYMAVDSTWDPYYSYYTDYVYEAVCREYWRAMPVAYVGLEPSISPGGGFAIYMGFGLRMLFVPDSKYIDEDDPDLDPLAGDIPLRERDDDYRRIEFSGLTIGVRLRF